MDVTHLQTYLETAEENYADSFKADIAIYLGDFEEGNSEFVFLTKLNSIQEIEHWVDTLTSKIVLKFNEEEEQLSDFIHGYIGLGLIAQTLSAQSVIIACILLIVYYYFSHWRELEVDYGTSFSEKNLRRMM